MDAPTPETVASFSHIVQEIAYYFGATFMVIGGMLPYVPQYLEIKKTDNHEGFSLYVCLVLLIANTLRIIFWFGHWFETPLLFQSICMNVTMLAMIHCCVSSKNRNQVVPKRDRIFTDLQWQYFWDWSDTQSYVEFVLTFATVSCFAMYMFMESPFFIETVGFVALLTEASLAAPQFYRNFKAGSTHGMSQEMVLMWLAGDVFKSTYFYLRSAPIQFLVCGLLQVALDLAVIGQCYVYSRRKKNSH